MTTKENEKQIKIRLNKLAELIDKHNYHYHTEDKPLISDSEYDKLVEENLELESKFPKLKFPKEENLSC